VGCYCVGSYCAGRSCRRQLQCLVGVQRSLQAIGAAVLLLWYSVETSAARRYIIIAQQSKFHWHSHEPVRAGRDRPLRLARVLHACGTHCTTGAPTSVHAGSCTDEQVAGTTYSYTSQSITQGAVTAQIARSCYRRWFQPCRRLYNLYISVYEHVYTFHRLRPCYASSSVSPANPR
jgi:hypothetical protein